MLDRIEGIGQDIRYARRSLRRFALPNGALALLLALGIGTIAAVLTLVERVLLAPLSAPHARELVLLHRVTATGNPSDGFSLALVDLLRRNARAVSALTAYDYTRLDVRVGATTEPATGRLLSGDGFDLLGVRAALGRSLGSSDDVPGRAAVAMLSFGYWQRRFGADPSVVGSTVVLNQLPVAIVGVLPASFTGLSVGQAPEDLWLPMTMHATLGLNDHQEVGLIGRLVPGANERSAAAELTTMYRDAERAGIVSDSARGTSNDRSRIDVMLSPQGLADLSHRLTTPLHVLLGAATLLLLVIWTNAAGLLAARARLRTREIAVRLAIGMSRARAVQQLLIENLVVTVAGSALGAIAAWWVVPALVRALVEDGDVPMINAAPDAPLIFALAGLALGGALLFAVLQAALATRLDLSAVLRAGRGPTQGRSLLRAGRVLVATQLALSLVLVLDGLLVADAVRRVAAANPGFDGEHVLMFWIFANSPGYTGAREQLAYREIAERLASIPGARSASLVRYRPGLYRSAPCRLGATPNDAAQVFVNVVGPSYFTTMGIPVLAGRDFTWADGATNPRVTIISEKAARSLFPGRSPIGSRLRIGDGDNGDAEIVGVVGSVKSYPMRPSVGVTPTCEAYVPVGQAATANLGQMNFVVKTSGDPSSSAPGARSVVASVDPTLSTVGAESGASVIRSYFGRDQALSWLAVGFSIVAILVAAMGLYGTLTLGVTMRLRELGIRVALGATASNARRLVVSDAGKIVVAGSVLGLVATAISVAFLRSIIFGLDDVRAVPIGAAVVVLGVSALLASYLPARRASAVDPVLVLREE